MTPTPSSRAVVPSASTYNSFRERKKNRQKREGWRNGARWEKPREMAIHDWIDERGSKVMNVHLFVLSPAERELERLGTFQQSLERSSGVALFIELGRRQLTLMMALCWEPNPQPSLLSFAPVYRKETQIEGSGKGKPFINRSGYVSKSVAYVFVRRRTLGALQFRAGRRPRDIPSVSVNIDVHSRGNGNFWQFGDAAGVKFCFSVDDWTSHSYGVTPILIYVTCCCVALTDVLLSSAQPSINCARCQPREDDWAKEKYTSPEIRPFVWRSRPKYTCAHLTWPLRRPIKQDERGNKGTIEGREKEKKKKLG